MRFASLGSGSRGNGALIECGQTLLLLDCGFSATQAKKRLARLEREAAHLAAIVVTHEHADHIGGVAALSRGTGVPVYATPGTARHRSLNNLETLRLFHPHESIAIGDLEVSPFPVPHDAGEPVQFVFGDGDRRFGVLTDVGSWTPHMIAQLNGCDALMLEANHDAGMLENGRYPPSLKHRVGGRQGHLSNHQAAQLLSQLDGHRLQHVVAAHLSEENNTPALAREALSGALGCEAHWIGVARQDSGLEWREII